MIPRLAFLACALLASGCQAASPSGGDSISVSLCIPRTEGNERTVEDFGPKEHFYVIVTNISGQTRRVWQERCSWGYYGLTFQLTDESGKTWIVKKQPIDWTVNFPAWWMLDPQESLVLDIHFGEPGEWEGFPLPAKDTFEVTMQAILEFHPNERSEEHGVWTGRAASKPMAVSFYHWKDPR